MYRLDDLNIDGCKIYQDDNLYMFSSDAVVLANLALNVLNVQNILEIGCGCGIISIIYALKRRKKDKNFKINALEIQKEQADIAKKNVSFNNLDEFIEVKHIDAKEYKSLDHFDLIISNPPYFKEYENIEKTSKNISRFEIYLKIDDLLNIAKKNLNSKKYLMFMYKINRMQEVISKLSEFSFNLNELILLKPKASKMADLAIFIAQKDGNRELKITELIFYNEDGTLSDKLKEMYESDENK